MKHQFSKSNNNFWIEISFLSSKHVSDFCSKLKKNTCYISLKYSKCINYDHQNKIYIVNSIKVVKAVQIDKCAHEKNLMIILI